MAFVVKQKQPNKRARMDTGRMGGSSNITNIKSEITTSGQTDYFFKVPPNDTNISLIELEECAIARLKLLKAIEAARDIHGKNREAYHSALDKLRLPSEEISLESSDVVNAQIAILPRTDKEHFMDKLSHFTLRLAFCRTPDAQKWFLQQELDLFKYRLFNMRSDDMALLLSTTDSTLQKVGAEEKEALSAQLQGAVYRSAVSQAVFVNSQDYWKLDFLDALDLVGQRRVFVCGGLAYVPKEDINVILATKFRVWMSLCLSYAARHYGVMEEEERLKPLLRRMNNRAYLGKEYNNEDAQAVNPAMINTLSQSSFPLCMRSINTALHKDHHLKHGARMQYGLFLKGIGLSLEGALTFFRDIFTKNMDMEKFDKQYAYNIRHNYGKEGKRTNYTPLHCGRIITSNPPAAGDCHGCPFRHWDANHLTEQLKGMNIADDRIRQIVSLSKESRYDKACSRVFEATHGLGTDTLQKLVTHPNEYFEMSRAHHSGKSVQAPVIDESQVARSFTQSQCQSQSAEPDLLDVTDAELNSLLDEEDQVGEQATSTVPAAADPVSVHME